MSDYDVVVVGGRVAGASTALLLARAGARVAVLDRSRPGSDTVSTHALMRAGVLQLSRWGLLDRVAAAGTPPLRRTRFHVGDGEPVEVPIRTHADVQALYAPRRHLLDKVILDAAADAGAEVLHRMRVTGLLRDDSGRVAGVVARGRAGESLPVTARVTVGADGVASVVARAVGAPVQLRGRTAGAVLYRYVSGLDATGYDWAYADRAAAGAIPTNGGDSCVFVATDPERLRGLRRAGAEAAFAGLLARMGTSFGEVVHGGRPSSDIRGWAGMPGYFRRPWGPGWALVGDAGYFKDPITTHGITDALRDAELLADGVLAVLGGAPEGAALSAYQQVRDRLSRRLFEVTEELAAFDWGPDQVRTLLRAASSAMREEVDHLRARPPRRDVLPLRRETGHFTPSRTALPWARLARVGPAAEPSDE